MFYKITKIVRAFWLVKNLWFIVPVNSLKTSSHFIKAIDHTFYGFTGVITHLGCWENTQKACKSLAFGSWYRTLAFVQIMKFFNQFQGLLLIMPLVGNWDQNCVKLHHWVSSEALTCKGLLASTKISCV